MPRFLLVHGAWHGSWCMERLADALRARGHRAEALDLPGRTDVETEASLQGDRDHVADRVLAAGEPAIVVGHSLAGLILPMLAKPCGTRLAGLVYLCAYRPRPGESATSIETGFGGAVMKPYFQKAHDGAAIALSPGAASLLFHDVSDDLAQNAFARLTPQPKRLFLDPATYDESDLDGVRQLYCLCRDDRVISAARQRAMASARPAIETSEIAAGHSPFLSQPEALSRTLSDWSKQAFARESRR
ncbi:Alpha/beta hydrolase family protein [Fulvimarina manganoxydans]|uniref:Alpha/beta hydrolase family protein n=1 Tax=Fulvimarina manganoxydans TaxID=937218 RepID=A0A1W2CJP2_9HYPH|nr:alpha/beta fold hydrolase [Fulvimarina manganoxydans]SMC85092.1 Alpha/beta hydrolase family protein [Fulvimarina manganoxydans]